MLAGRDLALALAIQKVSPLSELRLSTLLLIASVAGSVSYDPGADILAAGSVPSRTMIPVFGSVFQAGIQIVTPFDVPSLVLDRAVGRAFVAGPDGCRLAILSRPHVFSLIREFPELLLGLAGLDRGTVA